MQIEKKDGKMTVTGLIKTIEDSTHFKEEMYSLLNTTTKTLAIHITDSFIVTSSIIGTMLKAVNVDKAKLTVYVYQDDLYTLFDQLKLVDLLNIKKI